MKKYYSVVGTNRVHVDFTDDPQCPPGMIEMIGPYPDDGKFYVAHESGHWLTANPAEYLTLELAGD